MMQPDTTLREAEAMLALARGPVVTRDRVENAVADTCYFQHGASVVCILILQNGFKVTGFAAPPNLDDFKQKDIGAWHRLAYEDALLKVWALEGYLMQEFLYRAENPHTATPQEEQSMLAAEQSLTDIYPLPTVMDVDFTEVYGVAKLPVWKSHKLVFAARIMEQGTLHGSPERIEDDSFQTWRLENGGSVSVSKSLYARVPGGVAVGGFFVRYDDGYESWSPAGAFEGGYTRIG